MKPSEHSLNTNHSLPCPVCREGVKLVDAGGQTCPTCSTQLEFFVPFSGSDRWKIKPGTAVHYDPPKA